MWFGTIDGLNKYNGYDFEIFRPVLNDSTSISNNRINAIQEDLQQNLWIGTNNGLNFYNRNTNLFKHIPLYKEAHKLSSTKKIINTLLYDDTKNVIWIGTSNGLIKITLNDDSSQLNNLVPEHFVYSDKDEASIDNNNINSIVKDKDGNIWIETNGDHLNKYNPKTNNFERVFIRHNSPYELNHIPKRLFIDSTNEFWIGNDLSNIIVWNKGSDTFKRLSLAEKSIPIYTFFEGSKGLIWIVTDGSGIFLYDKQKEKLNQIVNNPSDPFSLPGNQVSDVIEDKDGIFWLATYNEGISKLDINKSSFGHYYYQNDKPNGLNEKIVQSVMQDSKDRIWLGAYNGGLNYFDEENNAFIAYKHDPTDPNSLSSNKIMYTFEDLDGDIWVCTLDGGVNKFNPETKRFKTYYHHDKDVSSIGQNSVWTGIQDTSNRVWFGLRDEGLDILDVPTQNFHHFKIGSSNQEGLLSNFVFSLHIDSQNRLLVGTSLGLNYINLDEIGPGIPEYITFYEVDINGISGNRINDITEDEFNNIWLGTDIGLFKLDENLQLEKSYFTSDGLANNLITGVIDDFNNNLWITSRSGLAFLNPKTHSIKNFNTHDGIQGLEFQSKSITRTKNGRILAGGINGFNVFQPEDIKVAIADTLFPMISAVKVNNEYVKSGDISETKELFLDYWQTNLSFEFLALHFKNQDKVKYAYKMDGLDDNYILAKGNRIVNYSNLHPGKFSFLVKATSNDDWDNAPVTSLNITLNSPPWESWWAYTIYSLLFLLALWYINQFFTNRIKDEKEREFDQMKLEFFINVSHEFRTPLTLILNPLDKLVSQYTNPEVVQSSAKSIQRSARRLLYLVNQLLDYRKMEVGMAPLQLQKGDIIKFSNDIYTLFQGLATKKNINYTFTATSDKLYSYFDFDKIEKILTNLISNAIKFTNNGGDIKVSVDKVINQKTGTTRLKKSKTLKNYIEIVVEDTGIGLTKDQVGRVFSRFYNVDVNKTGTGIGLNFCKGLVDLHGGEIFVESEYGVGSKFVVRIPYNKKAEASVVEDVKDEFLINSMKSVEYDMLISEDSQEVVDKESSSMKKEFSKVLIVEDNKELREHLRNELMDRYEIIEAVNGEEGLKKVLKHYPDIVISDVMMPKMDGFELCKRIKSEFETCHIPVILLTARALEEDRIEGYKTGADGYLGKPFNLNVLKARIINLLESKRIIREKFSKLGAVITPTEATSNSIDEAFLEKTTKVIIDNISDTEFKLEHLLKEVGIGRSQFYRKIQSITGQNPSNFIRTIRLKYASDLLLMDKYTIKEVTHMAGFNSAAYFGKTFKDLYNMTPSEYVEKNKPDAPAATDE
ncbi:two-component system sensor histidine kinase [Formosa agariphila KMM 3901]|uniref:histidine kinase n=1 Tax=Formosa agariphila (strain DSM 15362 / KCTC 12365 / LMG 23005 / KMM 3901 / M-2Alg 35-1) TaxID=1347342 RepID=T2KJV3_FORAG|nr:two-component system sensor histidine kinase [Formosa agariphila KMM 3901]